MKSAYVTGTSTQHGAVTSTVLHSRLSWFGALATRVGAAESKCSTGATSGVQMESLPGPKYGPASLSGALRRILGDSSEIVMDGKPSLLRTALKG